MTAEGGSGFGPASAGLRAGLGLVMLPRDRKGAVRKGGPLFMSETGMEFARDKRPDAGEIGAFFGRVFAASESAEEGRLVGGLARDLILTVPAADMAVMTCREGRELLGCIILTRLAMPEEARVVFLLAPVGVATARQGQGIGQALLHHGLGEMRGAGVDVVMTYGDPAYYRRVGFRQVTITEVQPPRPLSQPHGWLACGVDVALRGPSRCVAALDRAEYW